MSLTIIEGNNTVLEIVTQGPMGIPGSGQANLEFSFGSNTTLNISEVSGVETVTSIEKANSTVTGISTRDITQYEVFIAKDANTNPIFQPIRSDEVNTNEYTIEINGVSSSGFLTTETPTEWVLIFDNGPVTTTIGQEINIEISYDPDPVPWFDLTNVKAVKIQYIGRLDGLEDEYIFGEFYYVKDRDWLEGTDVASNNWDGTDFNVIYANSICMRPESSQPTTGIVAYKGSVYTVQSQ